MTQRIKKYLLDAQLTVISIPELLEGKTEEDFFNNLLLRLTIERQFITLARIFHHSRDEEVAKADGTRQTSILTQGCMGAYCPSQNTSLTQDPSVFPASAVGGDEISGLGEALHRASQEKEDLELDILDFPQIVGLRNRMVHDYDTVRIEILWDVTQEKLPPLAQHLRKLLN